MALSDVTLALSLAVGVHAAGFVIWAQHAEPVVFPVSEPASQSQLAGTDVADLVARWEQPVIRQLAVTQASSVSLDDRLDLVATSLGSAPVSAAAPPQHKRGLTVPDLLLPQTDRAIPEPAPPKMPPISGDAQAPLAKITPVPRPKQIAASLAPRPLAQETAEKSAEPQVQTRTDRARRRADARAEPITGGTTISQAKQQSLIAKWGGSIRRSLQRAQRYPKAAQGASGQARLKLRLSSNGALQSVQVIRSSGNAALDQAALAAARHARRFPAAPKALGSGSFSFSITLNFRPK